MLAKINEEISVNNEANPFTNGALGDPTNVNRTIPHPIGIITPTLKSSIISSVTPSSPFSYFPSTSQAITSTQVLVLPTLPSTFSQTYTSYDNSGTFSVSDAIQGINNTQKTIIISTVSAAGFLTFLAFGICFYRKVRGKRLSTDQRINWKNPRTPILEAGATYQETFNLSPPFPLTPPAQSTTSVPMTPRRRLRNELREDDSN